MALRLIIIVTTVLSLSSCQTPQGNFGAFAEYSIGLLTISVDSSGNVQLSVGATFTLPTPLGTFRAGLYYDPANELGAINTLTIRQNGTDTIYDLHGENFQVSFQSGYYRQINLSVRGNNVFLEIERLASAPVRMQANPESSPRIATAGSNCRVWTRPDVFDGETSRSLAEGTSVYIVSGPVVGRIRYDQPNLQDEWYQVSLTAEGSPIGWVWAGRLSIR